MAKEKAQSLRANPGLLLQYLVDNAEERFASVSSYMFNEILGTSDDPDYDKLYNLVHELFDNLLQKNLKSFYNNHQNVPNLIADMVELEKLYAGETKETWRPSPASIPSPSLLATQLIVKKRKLLSRNANIELEMRAVKDELIGKRLAMDRQLQKMKAMTNSEDLYKL